MSTGTSEQATVDPRVELARDVIALLDAKTIQATAGSYCAVTLKRPRRRPVELRDAILHGKVSSCEVCAKGAVFVAHVMRNNQFEIDAAGGRIASVWEPELYATMSSIFGVDQWTLLEALYEGWESTTTRLIGAVQARAFFNLLDETPSDDVPTDALNEWYIAADERRLRKLMQNIIDNGGELRLPVVEKTSKVAS